MRISIVGNIGCGKSTVLRRLSSVVAVVPEPVSEWGKWLDMFYQDPMRWATSFNMKALMSFRKWKDCDRDTVFERSPVCCRYVFADIQCEQGYITPLEKALYDELYDAIGWQPDHTIYLRTDPAKCLERVERRGRPCEDGVTLEYLSKVHWRYESLASTSGRCISIDGNRDADPVFRDVLESVRALLRDQ